VQTEVNNDHLLICWACDIYIDKRSIKTFLEEKVLLLNDLDRWQTDITMDITNKGIHLWKRNDNGGVDLYYDDNSC
jgi:hypothetical protein